MRVFLDTNVWLSAVVFAGLCDDILVQSADRGWLVSSGLVRAEAHEVLERKFPHQPAAIELFDAVWQSASLIADVAKPAGGRAFAALTRTHRWGVAAACGVAYGVTKEGLLLLLLLAAAGRAWKGESPVETDNVVLVQFVGLVLSLALLATIHVTLPS